MDSSDDYHERRLFRYDALKSRNAEIRLLRFLPESTPDDIHCSLEHFQREQAVAKGYTALSYCWGDETLVKGIRLNGRQATVTENLWQALSSISQHHDSVTKDFYWVDALCINQTDIAEKNEQVHKMWLTYSQAEMVYAWLGPEDEISDLAIDTMRLLQRHCESEYSICRGYAENMFLDVPPASADALQAFFERDYFARTWIKPEFLQARQVQLLCGRISMSFTEWQHFTTCGPDIIRRRHDRLQPAKSGVPEYGVKPIYKLLHVLWSYQDGTAPIHEIRFSRYLAIRR